MQAVEIFRPSYAPSRHIPTSLMHGRNRLRKLSWLFNSALASPLSFSLVRGNIPTFKLYSFVSSTAATEPTTPTEPEPENQIREMFEWYAQWYPVIPTCDLDERVPHAKKVMGLDLVVWWDRNEKAWKVFDDTCPHRLAPLSEGRIDQWGRLQCVYHGWCFNGSGDCKFIPQAPLDGPAVHNSKKACVAVYPSTVQNDIVWFWPNSDPQYKDILMKKKPPCIPELDDPIYTDSMNNRDLPYGYEVLIENFMDPAHSPYAHYGLLPQPKNREGGRPMELSVTRLDINGFIGKQEWGINKFISPCIFCAYPNSMVNKGNMSSQGNETGGTSKESAQVPKRKALLIFICIPVSPGKSRLIWTFPRNYGSWVNRIVPRWIFHLRQNLLLDSDLYLLHAEERKIIKNGSSNWQKSCFLPTKSDSLVIAFRTWLNKYSDGQVNWGRKYSEDLHQTPPREQLLDRYWSHVVNCRSCSAAYRTLSALEIAMQVISIASIGIVAAKQGMLSAAARATLVVMALLLFAASRWLSHFIYKNFHFHDYNHALV